VCARSAFGKKRRIRRLNRNDFYVGIFFFEISADTRYCATRTDTRNKNINLAVGVIPYFGRCRFIVRFGVCLVIELRRNKTIFNLLTSHLPDSDFPFL
jgi:hypothetical protein